MKFPASTVHTRYHSPLGPMGLAASTEHLVGVWFTDQQPPVNTSDWPLVPQHPVLLAATNQLDEYFAGHRTAFELPLDLGSGTAFQQKVWRALLSIACGSTQSYGWLSTQIGQPRAVRAVGAALGRNPLTIVVPCHRVLGATGTLTGYAAGLARKTALLQLENARPATATATGSLL